MKKHIAVANLVMVIGGAMTFMFSFFSFWGVGSFRVSAWGNGTFPLASLPAILGLAMVIVGMTEQAGIQLPEPVLSFSWRQIRFTWATVAAGIMLCYLVMDKGGGALKLGGLVMLLGALAMAVGSFMEMLGKGTNLVSIPGVRSSGVRAAPLPPPPPPPPSKTA